MRTRPQKPAFLTDPALPTVLAVVAIAILIAIGLR
jgi:hypothetical protein